ncbi:MAG: hypothetical protein ABJM06_12985 [Gilvibacter sp.]
MKAHYALIVLLLLCFVATGQAQESYTVNGETLTLKTEVDGPITLLWNTFDKQYRYFAKKGSAITELSNTKRDGKYQEQYKESLTVLTADSPVDASKVRLTLAGLRKYINTYNTQADPNYVSNSETVELTTRLGFFAGITNHRFTANPTNESLPLAGIEFEVLDQKLLPSHAIVFGFRQSFKNDTYMYSASQLSINYRFKFVNTPAVAVYINTKLVTYTYSKTEFDTVANPELPSEISGGNLQAPVIFGLGADIALGNGFIILGYNDAVALTIDDNGEFPIDFTLGYKFNLN